ncbi:hypothetical protein CPU12_12375 [Malaciobacter molluscorum LMG 25693]|uniref:Uncharacterized protein n=1 Tax=Malaciobacter molluscorum LMG 25693 TaxID=870501 RepID=A0A2G1DEY3_9BACT|nr:hypothetical protein [Malaciobacter molluscorum]AXX93256.1 hypothetical protein AMOL_2304 [Malaciobacter molluscorum LMG 25693]PHO17041.1 hypothetical protein CPU12_12375 [Malaciobacter molluscorum LMG 25693]RXJ95694.1 hypothetical protein CRV00_04420 [Malaciobacter molluscorum]
MDILSLFFIFVAVELFETNWQKSQTIYGLLSNNLIIYNKNIFLYFLFNASFIYSIFLTIYLNNYNLLMLSIVGIKFFDISFKLSILNKLNNGITFEEIMPNIKISFILRYFNVIAYPVTFLFASNYLQY